MTMIIIIASIIFLIGAFFLQGYRKIPIPYVGQVTVWGKRIDGKFEKEGWRFFPLYPLWYGVILIKVEQIPFSVVIDKARTPDRAESKVPVMLTFIPNENKLTEYINAGTEEGVKSQLTGKIQERIREWCTDVSEGPTDWIELNRSQAEATYILLHRIARKMLKSDETFMIPKSAQEVPTWIWLRYSLEPKPQEKSLLKNEEKWGKKKWKKVDAILASLSDDDRAQLKIALDKRRDNVHDLRAGSGKVELNDLGIILQRLNIGDIDVLGKVADRAENEAMEEQERQAETKEVGHILEKVKMYKETGYSLEQALEAVQTERGKISKSVQENKLNISPETQKMIENIFSLGNKIAENLKNKGGN